MGTTIFAFKLGGAPSTAVAPDIPAWEGAFAQPVPPAAEVDHIETSNLQHSDEPGARYFIDEYNFNPYRVQVRAGSHLLFLNNGNVRHEMVALDGSWSTGPLVPAEETVLLFNTPGRFRYICKEHPWSYGEIDVIPSDSPAAANARVGVSPTEGEPTFTLRVSRGRDAFRRHCGSCHGDDLTGRERAPALTGSLFAQHWGHGSARDLLDRIRTTMPQDKPGSLERQTYLDILAYLLQVDGFSSGRDSLDDTPAALDY